MVITFAQYSILTATQTSVTNAQLRQKTNFDQLMVDYYIMGLLNIGLISASDKEGNEHTCYTLTSKGEQCIYEYERTNPALIIKEHSQ